MDHSPHPSPFSATVSPPEEDALPTVPATSGSENVPHDRSDTPMNLQHASSALEAAYHRIRQFRRSLLEVADSTTIRPTRTTETAYPSGRSRANRAYSRRHSRRDSSSSNTTDSDDDNVPPLNLRDLGRAVHSNERFNSNNTLPPSPHGGVYPNRMHLESRTSRHRESLPDDASTSLGRRVAAREAAGAAANADPGSSTASRRWSRYGSTAEIFSNLQREIENYRALLRPAENPSLTPTTNSSSVQGGAQLRNPPRLQTNSSANSSLVPQPESVRRRLIPGSFPSRSSTMSTHPDRLSLLSNFSVQNLPTPLSATSSRPLLFEEPSSYVRAADFIDSEVRNDSFWSIFTGEGSDRSYVVRRRYNADGEEHVHPINLEWLDDPLHAAHNAGRRVAEQRSQPEPPPQRRRGWARLDPDGNEIPSEEEEELERARSEYRRQAQAQRSPLQPDPGFHSLQAPTTSTSLAPGGNEDDPMDIDHPRVRLGSHGRRDYYGSVLDSVLKVETITVEKRSSTPVEPYRPYPLPTPIEDMVWTPPKRKLRVNSVSKHASFAGR